MKLHIVILSIVGEVEVVSLSRILCGNSVDLLDMRSQIETLSHATDCYLWTGRVLREGGLGRVFRGGCLEEGFGEGG